MVRQQKIKVAELFAGVGGFRLGLERIGAARNLRNRKHNTNFKVVWSNQFEPKTNKQHASDIMLNSSILSKTMTRKVYIGTIKNPKNLNIDINEIDSEMSSSTTSCSFLAKTIQ